MARRPVRNRRTPKRTSPASGSRRPRRNLVSHPSPGTREPTIPNLTRNRPRRPARSPLSQRPAKRPASLRSAKRPACPYPTPCLRRRGPNRPTSRCRAARRPHPRRRPRVPVPSGGPSWPPCRSLARLGPCGAGRAALASRRCAQSPRPRRRQPTGPRGRPRSACGPNRRFPGNSSRTAPTPTRPPQDVPMPVRDRWPHTATPRRSNPGHHSSKPGRRSKCHFTKCHRSKPGHLSSPGSRSRPSPRSFRRRGHRTGHSSGSRPAATPGQAPLAPTR